MPNDEKHFSSIKLEVSRHFEDAETSKLAHWDAARVYEYRHKFLIGLPALVLSLLLTWILSSDARSMLEKQSDLKAILGSVPVLLSLIVSVLSGLGTFLNFNELASKHRTAAENLNALSRDCKNWDTDFPDSTFCEKAMQAVQGYRKRLNEINRDAPQIPKWAWLSVRWQREEGSTRYESDDTSRLTKLPETTSLRERAPNEMPPLAGTKIPDTGR